MAGAFFAELKRRNVLRVAFAYVAGSWLLIQVVETLFPVFGLSDGAIRTVVIVLAIGFVPAMVLAWVFEFTAQGVMTDEAAAAAVDGDRSRAAAVAARAKSFDRVVLVVLALAVGLFAFDKFVLSPEREQRLVEAASQQAAAGRTSIPNESVAVLPFLNMSGDPQNEYFSDGLTETLLHMLAQLPDLLVSARTSSFAFKGQNMDIRDIALALGVAHILEGSVQKARNRVRVTAQLIRAADGFHLWSQNYDRTLDDVFAIQDEIAGDVAAALGSSLLTTGKGAIQGVQTADVSAFDIYLHGLEQLAINTNESLLQAAQRFEAALQQDPEFSDAAIALVRSHLFLFFKLGDLSPYSREDSAAILADVLAREPDHLAAQGLSLLVQIFQAGDRLDLRAQEELIEQTVALMHRGFGDSYVRRLVVEVLGARERRDEALALLRDGLMVDPLNYDLVWAQATLYAQAERYEDAVESMLKARKLAPDNPLVLWKLGVTSVDAGDLVAGLDWTRQAVELDPGDPVLPFFLARYFYQQDLVQAGDHWGRRARQVDPGRRGLLASLSMLAAQARRDDAELLRIARQVIDDSLSSNATPGLPVGGAAYNFAIVMHKRGRSRQGLDYLIGKDPRLGDMAWVPKHEALFALKAFTFDLWSGVMSADEFARGAKQYVQGLRDAGYRFEGAHMVNAKLAIWQQDEATAKTILLETLRDYPLDSGKWYNVLNDPWLAELFGDRDVAPRIAATAKARQRQRESVQLMLLRPEWRMDSSNAVMAESQ